MQIIRRPNIYFMLFILLFVTGALAWSLAAREESRTRESKVSASDAQSAATSADDHQHDFDFEFGSWKVHLKRLLHPLAGSNEWVEMDGTSVVRKLWDGRGNLGELEVGDAKSHIEGLSLRLYNPETRQWSIYWASSRDGALGKPMIGAFHNGRGEFYDQEDLNGKAIFVRFIFSDMAANSFRLEQAFSPDGGRTWETNGITTFTRAGRP